MSDELAFASALELAAQLRAGTVLPVELVELYLDRIERLDPKLNSYVTVDAEGALAAARTVRPGPFSGVPISIKDLNDTAGLRTTYSCKAFAENVPQTDHAVVQRIREAGFVVLGKTNTPEFGSIGMTESELFGDCRNPWDIDAHARRLERRRGRRPRGRPLPGRARQRRRGSIRIPSSCCGLFGIKPSRGRVSPAPFGSGSLGSARPGRSRAQCATRRRCST